MKKNKEKDDKALYYAVLFYYEKNKGSCQRSYASLGAVVEEKETGFLIVNGIRGAYKKAKRMIWQKNFCKIFFTEKEAIDFFEKVKPIKCYENSFVEEESGYVSSSKKRKAK